MDKDLINKILHSTGYLPPRNDGEMLYFERIYSNVEVDKSFHLDVDSIVNGICRYNPATIKHIDGGIAAEDSRMAARNYESIPSDIIEKIKKQHNPHGD